MITSGCSPHCGIASGNEGHCPEPECHDGPFPGPSQPDQDRAEMTARMTGAPVPAQPAAGIPMCARWYDGVQVMPWIAYLDGCLCAVSAQALPRQHGPHCPVRLHWEREHAPGQDRAGAAGIIAATGA